MKLLIAEDEPVMRMILFKHAREFGYEVTEAEDGEQALAHLRAADGPRLALLDWMMPGCGGVDICRTIRKEKIMPQPYIIIVTSRTDSDDIVLALDSGADDYVVKPYVPAELRARLGVGRRLIEAASHITQLQGLLPICASCKKIRDGHDYWHSVENYFSDRADVMFSHSICPECMDRLYPGLREKI